MFASPLARRLAKEAGIDPSRVFLVKGGPQAGHAERLRMQLTLH